jgi:hypothetical protein
MYDTIPMFLAILCSLPIACSAVALLAVTLDGGLR